MSKFKLDDVVWSWYDGLGLVYQITIAGGTLVGRYPLAVVFKRSSRDFMSDGHWIEELSGVSKWSRYKRRIYKLWGQRFWRWVYHRYYR